MGSIIKFDSDGFAYFVGALALLILPLQWVWAVFIAAVCHELGHIVAVCILKGRIRSIRIGIGGAVITASSMEPWKVLASTLAGPAVSLILSGFMGRFPRVAFAGLMQGMYNLLPLYPLDGGRAVEIITKHIIPEKQTSATVRRKLFILVIGAVFFFSLLTKCLGCFLILVPPVTEKLLAKRRKKGYNKATIYVR